MKKDLLESGETERAAMFLASAGLPPGGRSSYSGWGKFDIYYIIKERQCASFILICFIAFVQLDP